MLRGRSSAVRRRSSCGRRISAGVAVDIYIYVGGGGGDIMRRAAVLHWGPSWEMRWG